MPLRRAGLRACGTFTWNGRSAMPGGPRDAPSAASSSCAAGCGRCGRIGSTADAVRDAEPGSKDGGERMTEFRFVERLPDLIQPEDYAAHPDGRLVRLR